MRNQKFSITSLFLLGAAIAAPAHSASRENHACGGAMEEVEARYDAPDGTGLAAALIRPENADAAPALVLLQGSGTSDRNNGWARAFAEELAGCGIAVLLTDKRGSGESGGSWQDASFETLAWDGVAGLRWLARQRGIDSQRVGFLGLSQGGMIAPLAASLAGNADVVVNVSGGVVPLEQSLLYELMQTYRQRDIPPATALKLVALARASFDYLRDESKWSSYLALRNSLSKGDYAFAVESWPDTRDSPYWKFWRQNFRFDSAPHWSEIALDTPALTIYGAEDAEDNVDVRTSVDRFVSATRDAPVAITVTYSDTGHLIVEKGQGRLKTHAVRQIADFVLAGGNLIDG